MPFEVRIGCQILWSWIYFGSELLTKVLGTKLRPLEEQVLIAAGSSLQILYSHSEDIRVSILDTCQTYSESTSQSSLTLSGEHSKVAGSINFRSLAKSPEWVDTCTIILGALEMEEWDSLKFDLSFSLVRLF